MEKYAVETPVAEEKIASDSAGVCHQCGASLVKDTNVLKCPNCGTKPFEAP
jgi:rubrerythrin